MREAFHEQLDTMFHDLAGICGRVETAVRLATEALLTGDAAIAEQVISADVDIDRARERVEDSAFLLLSLQQPVASDLRTVVAALRMVSELERMGDLSVHVAKIARLRVPNLAVPDEVRPTIERMAAGRRGHGRAGCRRSSPSRDIDGRDRARHTTTRRWTSCAAPASPSCCRPTGATGSRRPSTSRCWVATTSGSPTTRCRSPTGSSSWSPARTRPRWPSSLRRRHVPDRAPVASSSRSRALNLTATPRLVLGATAQRPWFATAAAAAAAASGSRYVPPGDGSGLSVVELVDQRHAGRDVEPGDVVVADLVEVLHDRRAGCCRAPRRARCARPAGRGRSPASQ